jgi:hypothetical protein
LLELISTRTARLAAGDFLKMYFSAKADSMKSVTGTAPGGAAAGAPLQFRTGSPGSEIELAPFHRIAHERCSLYWPLA